MCVLSPKSTYNPLDKKNLGESIARALLAQPIHLLPPRLFSGAGIYAIYYGGDFPAYRVVAEANVPIYVGKAVPTGSRKGGADLRAAKTVVYRRLMDHVESIQAVPSLQLSDFTYRALLLEDIWIPLGESLLIDMFTPVWNCVVDGFGNHDPGAGRYNQQRSPWDVLHPGRPWAEKCQATRLTPGVVAAQTQQADRETILQSKTLRSHDLALF